MLVFTVTNFLNAIKDSPSKPALWSLIPAYSDFYIPKSVNPELPVVLSSFFNKCLANADYPALVKRIRRSI